MSLSRAIDMAIASGVLMLAGPFVVIAMLAVWAQDFAPPLYLAPRVGRHGIDFRMVKLRSMCRDADRMGGTSAADGDPRVTPLGRWLRRSKIDELPQFGNVLAGHMAVVGPRPNTRDGGVDCYTAAERRLLGVRPGITDLASIVFADEGAILAGQEQPDLAYDTLIRPWKNRLGLLYINHRSVSGDMAIVGLTALALISRPLALRGVAWLARRWGGEEALCRLCLRRETLPRGKPPIWA